jgi:hypothetical protein
MFYKLDMLPSSGEREMPTVVGSLERPNLNQPSISEHCTP